MKNELENLLTNKMSLEELAVDPPADDLVIKARNMIALRKKPVKKETLLDEIKSFFYGQLKVYQVVFFGLVIAGCFFWFSKPQEDPNEHSKMNNYLANEKAITSSTILASNNHKETNGFSATTSTILTSIKTFVTRN